MHVCVFVYGELPANGALPLGLQCCEHDNNGVIPGRSLNEAPELVAVHPYDRTPRGPLHHLVHLLRQHVLNKQTIKKPKDTSP